MIKQAFPVSFLIGFLKIIRKGKEYILFSFRKSQKLFVRKLRLIRKNRRKDLSEFFSHSLKIYLMGQPQKFLDGFWI